MDVFMVGIRKYVVFVAVFLVVLRNLAFIPLGETLLVALVATLLSYLVADVGILPTWGNAAATSADFFVVFIVIWGSQLVWPVLHIGIWDAILVAGVVAGAEWFFHEYLGRRRVEGGPG